MPITFWKGSVIRVVALGRRAQMGIVRPATDCRVTAPMTWTNETGQNQVCDRHLGSFLEHHIYSSPPTAREACRPASKDSNSNARLKVSIKVTLPSSVGVLPANRRVHGQKDVFEAG